VERIPFERGPYALLICFAVYPRLGRLVAGSGSGVWTPAHANGKTLRLWHHSVPGPVPPYYPPVGPVLWTSQIAPILEPVFFRFLGLKVCNAKAHVLTGASMRGVPNRVFLTGGYMGVFFTFLLIRWCPFLRAQIVRTCLL